MVDVPRARAFWLLVAASGLLAALFFYLMFAAYLPTKQRIVRLEQEMRGVYAREAALQTRLAQQDQRQAQRERQLRAERDAFARRIEELERQLAAARGRRR